MNYLERAKELKEEMIKNKRFLHQNPEIGMELPITTAFIKEKLKEMGIEAVQVGKSGVTGIVGGKKIMQKK